MHRLVQTQAFAVRPLEHGAADAGHLPLVGQRDELDVLGAALGLHPLDQLGQREAHPRDHHRPALDATQAVDTLFHRRELHQVVQVVGFGGFHQTLHADLPGVRAQRAGIARRVGLVGAEFVEVVVRGDLVVRGGLFHSRVRRIRLARQLGEWRVGGKGFARRPRRQRCTRSAHGSSGQKAAALLEDVLRRDLAGGDVVATQPAVSLNQHDSWSSLCGNAVPCALVVPALPT